ncbi:MAG: tRNA 2-thiocytidine(32) synthetase TtcA [Clostridiales bacterium]|nr:tRNA 2-thiocytidine(32) synthetase TtcA [Clostridiales bacterium]
MKTFNTRRLLSFVRQACQHYDMIAPHDKIAVGLSGGKDSTALLIALNEMRRFYPVPYEIVGITIDMGFSGMDFSPLTELCQEIGIEYRVISSDIARVVFDIRKESNPCALCAKMRRGVLHDAAKTNGCNKIALGHHFDDIIDTFMLNLIHEGRLGAFSPVTYLSRKEITMIRPLIYAKEKDIQYFIKHNDIPIITSTCPEDKHTEREEIKQMIEALNRKYNGFSHRVMNAIETAQLSGYSPCIRTKRTKSK